MADSVLSPDSSVPRLPSVLHPRKVALLALGTALYSAYVAVGMALGIVLLAPTLRPVADWPEAVAEAISTRSISGSPLSSLSTLTFGLVPMVDSPLAFFPQWRGTEKINVLLLGVDQREDERQIGLPTRSDTLMVVSIDPVQKSAALISFPRDLWVTIPGFGEDRINTAFRYGELRRVEGGGPGLAARTIEQNFGLRPQYYATVDFRGFQEIVNTLGGIVVDVPRPLKDEEYPTDDYGLERVYFAPGPQLMDGATALKYARTRHSDSDFARMARQQQVVLAVRDRALRLNMLPKAPSLLEQGMRTVNTNFTAAEVLSLARLAGEMDTSAIGSLVIDRELVTPFSGIGGASLQIPRRDDIRRAIQRTLADPTVLREGARVEIVSTPARGRQAQQTAERLASEGLQVVRLSSPLAAEPDATSVMVHADKPRTLATIVRALALGADAVAYSPEAEGQADIRIVLGRDLQGP